MSLFCLLQNECVSTKFYLLISLCFNQLLHIYVSRIYRQNRVYMIRTLFAATEFLRLYFSRKTVMIHDFIENLKSRIAWNNRDDLNSHCGLCIFFLAKFKLLKKSFYCLRIMYLQLRFVLKKKNTFCPLLYTALTLNIYFVEFTFLKKSTYEQSCYINKYRFYKGKFSFVYKILSYFYKNRYFWLRVRLTRGGLTI